MDEVVPALCAGIVSTVVCNPLDKIRVNYQLNKELKFNKLYKGINYGIIAVPSFWVIYFPMYKKTKNSTFIPNGIAAYISCCCASTITTPFWVLRQREYTGASTKNLNIYNLYKGLIPTYVVNLNFTVQIPIYEYLKEKTDSSTFNTFINTSISKTIATCVFYPIDTIRTYMRDNRSFILRGVRCYYRGIGIYLLRSIPYHTSVFCTYEYVQRLIK